ncbi:MAG: hypothetical protein LBL18_01370, partial [Bacteroidales bacterium]|nr:hypothetical protein [Bacteroidales bacterium]
CNFKYIAGNRYELTEDGIQYSRETTYSNAWADVRLGKINDSESEDLSGDFVFGFVFMTLNDIRINVSVETEGYWILSYNGTKVSGYDYSGVVCSLPINTTSAPITYKFTLKNLLSERVISEKNLTINPISVSRIFDNTFDLTFN